MDTTSATHVRSRRPPFGAGTPPTDRPVSDPEIGGATLNDDPVALEELRSLRGAEVDRQPAISVAAFTVQSLAAELGRTPRSIPGAIERGERETAKRGRGLVISAEAVSWWESSPHPRARRRPARPACARAWERMHHPPHRAQHRRVGTRTFIRHARRALGEMQ